GDERCVDGGFLHRASPGCLSDLTREAARFHARRVRDDDPAHAMADLSARAKARRREIRFLRQGIPAKDRGRRDGRPRGGFRPHCAGGRRYLPVELFMVLEDEGMVEVVVAVDGDVFEAMLPRSFFASASALSSSALACFLHAAFSLPFWSSHF